MLGGDEYTLYIDNSLYSSYAMHPMAPEYGVHIQDSFIRYALALLNFVQHGISETTQEPLNRAQNHEKHDSYVS